MTAYKIKYTTLCHKGKIRDKNQDNFWCMGRFLKKDNDGLSEPVSGVTKPGESSAFAVFDGLGGEQQGEMAAYIAAKSFDKHYKRESKKNDTETFLNRICNIMNRKICDYAKKNHIRNTGTTTAIIKFGIEDIGVCNLGDSRIYRMSEGVLEQVSCDHSMPFANSRKAPLSQHLGIEEKTFLIEPFIEKKKYAQGDYYLICSDGLTDMVSDEEISKIFVGDVSCIAEKLMQQALENGGSDNITLIVCEVQCDK